MKILGNLKFPKKLMTAPRRKYIASSPKSHELFPALFFMFCDCIVHATRNVSISRETNFYYENTL